MGQPTNEPTHYVLNEVLADPPRRDAVRRRLAVDVGIGVGLGTFSGAGATTTGCATGRSWRLGWPFTRRFLIRYSSPHP